MTRRRRKDAETVLLRVRREDWQLLVETLQLDARSGAFDPPLRRRLKQALARLRLLQERKES